MRLEATRKRRFPNMSNPKVQRALLKLRIAIKFKFRYRNKHLERQYMWPKKEDKKNNERRETRLGYGVQDLKERTSTAQTFSETQKIAAPSEPALV
jgi:hypothetical protein